MGCFNQWSRAKPLSGTITKKHYAYLKGISVGHIANQRGLAASAINGNLEQAIQAGEPVDLTQLWTPEQALEMTAAFEKTGFGNLTGAKELLWSTPMITASFASSARFMGKMDNE